MKLNLTINLSDGASVESLKKRIYMLDGVVDIMTDESTEEDQGADLAVWIENGTSPYNIEDLLHGTRGVKRVSILK